MQHSEKLNKVKSIDKKSNEKMKWKTWGKINFKKMMKVRTYKWEKIGVKQKNWCLRDKKKEEYNEKFPVNKIAKKCWEMKNNIFIFH